MTSPALNQPGWLPSLRVMRGFALRHIYLYLGSWPRLVEMMYWPVINISLYGFLSLWMVQQFGPISVMTDSYLGGLLLMEIMTRCVMGMLVGYMEEVWSRNLGHLFASPMRLRDYVAGLVGLCSARCLVSVIPAYIIVYYLFHYSILSLSWHLPLYAALLCMNGWWYGLLIVALLLRFGLAAEWLGWMSTWLLLPFMAPYYPLSVLPPVFQAIARCLPGTYVFESMKAQVATGSARPDDLGIAFALNIGYFLLSAWVFNRAYRHARNSGGLLQMGE